MNKELWKKMSFIQKIEWIIQYYGLTILFGIIAVVVSLSLGKAFLEAGDKGDMQIIILDNGMSSELCYALQKKMDDVIDGEAEMTSYAKASPMHMQAFSVRLTADDLDIVIAPEEEMLQMAGNGYLLPFDEDGITAFYSKYPEECYLKLRAEDASEETIFGVALASDSRYMTYRREAGAREEETMYLGVTIKKINDENIEKAASYLLDDMEQPIP